MPSPFRGSSNSLNCPCFDHERGTYPKYCATEVVIGGDVPLKSRWEKMIQLVSSLVFGRRDLGIEGVEHDCQTPRGCFLGNCQEELVSEPEETGVPTDGNWVLAESRSPRSELPLRIVMDP